MAESPETQNDLIVGSYFDGESIRDAGPYRIACEGGRIASLSRAAEPGPPPLSFAMPGLVEGHCHLFLDGGQLDPRARKRQVAAPVDEKAARARSRRGRFPAGGAVTRLRTRHER